MFTASVVTNKSEKTLPKRGRQVVRKANFHWLWYYLNQWKKTVKVSTMHQLLKVRQWITIAYINIDVTFFRIYKYLTLHFLPVFQPSTPPTLSTLSPKSYHLYRNTCKKWPALKFFILSFIIRKTNQSRKTFRSEKTTTGEPEHQKARMKITMRKKTEI